MVKKKTVKLIILFILLIFISFLLPFYNYPEVIGASDITYVPYENTFYSGSNLSYDEVFNLRNQTLVVNNSIATFNFNNHSLGGFEYWDDSGGSVSIHDSYIGHEHILKLEDTSGVNRVQVKDTFENNIVNGTLEFFLTSDDMTDRTKFAVQESGENDVISLRIELDRFQYYDGSWNDFGIIPLDDTWYHIRIDFESSKWGYMGLSEDTFMIYINGIQYGSYSFLSSENYLNYFWLVSDNTDSNYVSYWDNIGYTWNANYTFRGNYEPIITQISNILEVDRFEFSLEGMNDIYDNGDDNPCGFTDVEIGGGDYVNEVQVGGGEANVWCEYGGAGTRGLKRDFDISGEVFNISYSIYPNDIQGSTAYVDCIIESKDGTTIVDLRLTAGNGFSYYDGSIYNEVYGSFSAYHEYIITVFVDYWIDSAYIQLWDIGALRGRWIIPLLDYNKEGLSEIKCRYNSVGAGDLVEGYIRYIGVYKDGDSIAEDFGWGSIELSSDTWNLDDYNFFVSNFTEGDYTCGLITPNFFFPETYGGFYLLNDQWHNITDYSFLNLYNESRSIINPHFAIFTNETISNPSNLDIYGVSLKQGSNIYPMSFQYSGVLPNESYFYVENNYLKWNYEADNNSELEYIQGTFDITDMSGVNRSLGFTGQSSGYSTDYLRASYSDATSSIYELTANRKTYYELLAESKVIDSFIVLITDNNYSLIAEDFGWISTIELNYVPNYAYALLTTNLLGVLIPLIIMLTPTLMFYKKFGKQIILPMLIIMTVIAFITQLIPVWVFIILILGFGALLFLQRRKGVFDL